MYSLTSISLLLSALGVYLMIFGLMGNVKARRSQGFRFFSISSFVMGVQLSAGSIEGIQVLQLLTWPLFYLFIRQLTRSSQIQLSHLTYTTPFVLWGLIWITTKDYAFLILDAFNLLIFTTFITICLVKSLTIRKQFSAKNSHEPFYLKWIINGIILLLIHRLVIPILSYQLQEEVHSLLISIYFIGISSFSIQPSDILSVRSEIITEEKSNYKDDVKRRLHYLLKVEKVYLIPDLSLNELASKMGMRPSELSAFFNSSMGLNFNEVINEHRVEEVKRLINDPRTDAKATMMELAYQAGFNSKASFNRIFKVKTGITPKEFKQLITT